MTARRIPDGDRALFRRACDVLRALTAKGYEIYVAGSGSVHLMSGPSHDDSGRAQRENVIETASGPRMSGGDSCE